VNRKNPCYLTNQKWKKQKKKRKKDKKDDKKERKKRKKESEIKKKNRDRYIKAEK